MLWWLNNKIEHRDRYLSGSMVASIIMALGYACRATFIGGITRSGGIETFWIVYAMRAVYASRNAHCPVTHRD